MLHSMIHMARGPLYMLYRLRGKRIAAGAACGVGCVWGTGWCFVGTEVVVAGWWLVGRAPWCCVVGGPVSVK